MFCHWLICLTKQIIFCNKFKAIFFCTFQKRGGKEQTHEKPASGNFSFKKKSPWECTYDLETQKNNN